jgi:hypothetical protein
MEMWRREFSYRPGEIILLSDHVEAVELHLRIRQPAAEDSCSMDIPGCQIGPGTQAEVLMLDVRRAIGRRRQRRLFSAAGLNTGLTMDRTRQVSHCVHRAPYDDERFSR